MYLVLDSVVDVVIVLRAVSVLGVRQCSRCRHCTRCQTAGVVSLVGVLSVRVHLVYPPKFCITIVSNFSSVLQSQSQNNNGE